MIDKDIQFMNKMAEIIYKLNNDIPLNDKEYQIITASLLSYAIGIAQNTINLLIDKIKE